MATEILLPNGYTVSGTSDLSGAVTNIDQGVDTPNDTLTVDTVTPDHGVETDTITFDFTSTTFVDGDTITNVTFRARVGEPGSGTGKDYFGVDLLIGGTAQGTVVDGSYFTTSWVNQSFNDTGWNSDWTASELNGLQIRCTLKQDGMPAAMIFTISEVEVVVTGTKDYTITADAGSYSVTGVAATLSRGRAIAADAGSFAVTGFDATLTIVSNPVLTADAGSYSVTGSAATLIQPRTLAALAGVFAINRENLESTSHNALNWTPIGSPTEAGNVAADPFGNLELDRIGDDNAGAFEGEQLNASWFSGDDIGNTYTFTAYILKDSIPRTTRFAYFDMRYLGVSPESNILKLDTSTGEFETPLFESDNASAGVIDVGDWWRIRITAKSINQGNNLLRLFFYAAAGASATWVTGVAAQGDVVFGAYQFTADDIGRYPAHIRTSGGAVIPPEALAEWHRVLNANAGSYSVTGIDATLTVGGGNPVLTAEAGAITITGAAAGLELNQVVAAAAGSVTIAGFDAALTTAGDFEILAEAGNVTIAGAIAGLELNQVVAADAGAIAITGAAAGLELNQVVAADAGAIAITGAAASLELNQVVAAEAGAIAITGAAAGLELNQVVAADAGSVTIAGAIASLELNQVVAADAAAITITGAAAGLELNQVVAADAGSVTIAGAAASLELNQVVAADAGAIAITGFDAALTTGGDVEILAEAGSVTITGTDAVLAVGYVIECDSGNLGIIGTDANLQVDYSFAAELGIIAVTGFDATLIDSQVRVIYQIISGSQKIELQLAGGQNIIQRLSADQSIKQTLTQIGDISNG